MTETAFFIKVNLEHGNWYAETLESSTEGDRVTIDYEPTNPKDENAIICKTLSSEPLGYLPGRAAKVLGCVGDKEQPFQMEGVIVSIEEKENGYYYVPIICKITLKKEYQSKFKNLARQVIERATDIDLKVVRVSDSQYMHLFETSVSNAPCSSQTSHEIIDLCDSPCRSTTNIANYTTPSPESPDEVPVVPSHEPDFKKALLKKRDSVTMKEVVVDDGIYFIKGLGYDMIEKRVDLIINKLRNINNNANIHKKFCKSTVPRFLVLDFAMTLEKVSKMLGFDSIHEMAALLFDKCHFVSPTWVLDHKGIVTNTDIKPRFEDEWKAKRDWLKSQNTKKRQREN